MTEDEYCDVSDLAILRNIKDLLRSLNCFEDPNKSRLKSVDANINLMVNDVNKRIGVD